MAEKKSAYDWFKGLSVSLGTVALGIFVMFGPPDLREEIPRHVEFGLGIAAFGALFFAALFVTRAKSLLLSVVIGAFSAGAILAAFYGDLPLWQAALIGVTGFFSAIFAIACLVAVFTGEDPT